MNAQIIGIILGGIVPLLIFVHANLSRRKDDVFGIAVRPYVITACFAVVLLGFLAFFLPALHASASLSTAAFSIGFAWGVGVSLIAICLVSYYTVFLALLIFSDWKSVHISTLMMGTILAVIGAVFLFQG